MIRLYSTLKQIAEIDRRALTQISTCHVCVTRLCVFVRICACLCETIEQIMSVGVLTALILPFLYVGLLSIGTMLEDPMGADASDEPTMYSHFALHTHLDDIDKVHYEMRRESFWSDAFEQSTKQSIVGVKMRATESSSRSSRRQRRMYPLDDGDELNVGGGADDASMPTTI